MAKRQSKGSAKRAPKPSYTPLLDAENVAATTPSGSSYNAELLASGHNAWDKLVEDVWPGVKHEEPHGRGQAPFDATQCKASLFGNDENKTKHYKCSQSIFRVDALFNADPSVPLRQASINDLGARFYSSPAPYHGSLVVAVPSDWMEQCCDVQKAKPVSPMENFLAFLLSIYRDMDDEEKMVQWKEYALSVDTTYICANSEDDIYFANANLRQDMKAMQETMTHTTLQRVFSVLNCKARMERVHGSLSTENFCKRYAEHYRAASKDEEVTEAFIDTAITLSKRVLSHPSLVDLLLRADESRGDNPFDSWTKMQVIVSKCKSPGAIEWVLHCMFDGWKNSYLPADQLTWRGLRESLNGKGTVDLMIQLMDFREYLFSKVVPSSFDWGQEVLTKMKEISALHDVYREKNGHTGDLNVDLTWRAGWPKSAEMFWLLVEDCLFSDSFLTAFRNLVRHRKPVVDWVDNPEVSTRLDAVKAQYEKEMKKKKEEAGEQDADPITVEDDLAGASKVEDESGLGHMQVLPVQVEKKTKKGSEVIEKAPDLEEEAQKKVEAFKKKACQTVRTHVKLIVEEDNTSNMTKALSATAFGQWRGEVDAETRQVTKSVAIYFDTKICGEAETQPSLRLPPLRDGRHQKLFSAAIALRYDAELASLRAGDAIVIMDGGRDGLHSSLMSALKPTSGKMTKEKFTKYLMWCETSLRERKSRDRGAQVNQVERLIVVLPEEQTFSFHQRQHYEGTNRGDVIYPVKAPNWEDSNETWRLTLAQKKVLYGVANRPPVGGKPDVKPSDKQGRRRDTDEEPVAYHALPLKAVEEIFCELNVGYMLDLSCCDGKAALVAIFKRVPYVGVAFNEEHARLLMMRLESEVFRAMQTASSPLYEPALEALLSKKKKKPAGKAKAKGNKKAGTDEEEADANEEDDEDNDDEKDGEDMEGSDDDEEEAEDEGEDEQEEEEQEEDEDDDKSQSDGDDQDEDDDEEKPKKGLKRKAQAKAKGSAKAKAKGKKQAKAKSRPAGKAKSKGKGRGRGRPKGGSEAAADVLNKLKGLM